MRNRGAISIDARHAMPSRFAIVECNDYVITDPRPESRGRSLR